MKKIWQQKHQILSQNLSINWYKKQNEKDIINIKNDINHENAASSPNQNLFFIENTINNNKKLETKNNGNSYLDVPKPLDKQTNSNIKIIDNKINWK